MLWTQPQRTAKNASPTISFNVLHVSRPSFFISQIIGSIIALRYRGSLAAVPETPRRAPLMKTFTFYMPWTRHPRSTIANSGFWSDRISTCSNISVSMWPS